MHRIDAAKLNLFAECNAVANDYNRASSNKEYKGACERKVRLLGDLINWRNDTDIIITGEEQLDEGYYFLWVLCPLDEKDVFQFFSRLSVEDFNELLDDTVRDHHKVSQSLFDTINESKTKCDLKFSNGQWEAKTLKMSDNTTLLWQRALKVAGENIETIHKEAFSGGLKHSSINSVDFPNVKEIGKGAFINCENLKEIDFPNVREIDESAFQSCVNLKKINLPKVEIIGNQTFCRCDNLEKVNLPSVRNIGSDVFSCSYSKYNTNTSLKEISIPKAENIGENAFANCQHLTEISLENEVIIGESAFEGCISLRKVYMPKVISIGENAFNGCENLINVTLPKINVADNVFQGCDKVVFNYIGQNGRVMPQIKSTNSDSDVLFIDNYARNWDRETTLSFFQNLELQKKPLNYALTTELWKPPYDFPIPDGGLDTESVYASIVKHVTDDLNNEVACERKKAAFLLASGQRDFDDKGILLRRVLKGGELDYAGLYVLIISFGKRFTVQIFTLYLSQDKDATTEGLQALDLKKDSDTVHGGIIETMRNTILKAITGILKPDSMTY